MIRAGCPSCGAPPLAPDQRQQPVAQHRRRHDQFAKARRIRVAGQRAPERGRVGGDIGVGRQEPHVRVEARGAVVVVAGPQVDVAAEALFRSPYDQANLGVHFVVADAVDDVRAHLLQAPRPADVPRLVEARHQLDEHRHLFSLVGRPRQRHDDRRVAAGAVERLLDRQHVRVLGGGLHERHHRIERFVRMVQQDVAPLDRREDVVLLDGRDGHDRRCRREPQPVVARQIANRRQGADVDEAGQTIDVVRARRQPGSQGARRHRHWRRPRLPAARRRCGGAVAATARRLRGTTRPRRPVPARSRVRAGRRRIRRRPDRGRAPRSPSG